MVLGEVALLLGVASFLYGLTPNDPLILSLAAAVLAGVALMA